jgi:hypothetical protein
MFNRRTDKAFNEGTEWAMDTFAWTVETMLLDGKSVEEAYQITKDIYVNQDSLKKRLDAWKELNV